MTNIIFQICGQPVATVKVTPAELSALKTEPLLDAMTRILLRCTDLNDQQKVAILNGFEHKKIRISSK